MDVQTGWDLTLELLEHSYRLREFTYQWLKIPNYRDYKLPFTKRNKWTIVNYVREGLWQFQYRTLCMLKWHTPAVPHVITVYNNMFAHMVGVMPAFTKEKTKCKEDFYFAVKFAWQKLSKYYTEVTTKTGMLLISAQIHDSFQKLGSLRKWHQGIDWNPGEETFYTTQYQEAYLKNVENDYCTKHICLPVHKPESILNSNLVSSAMACRHGHSLYDLYDLSSNDANYIILNNVAEMTPRCSDCVTRLMTATSLNFYS